MKAYVLLLGLFLLSDCQQRTVKVKAVIKEVTLTNVTTHAPPQPVVPPQPSPVKYIPLDSVWIHQPGGGRLLIKAGKVFLQDSLVYTITGDDTALIMYKSAFNRVIALGDTSFLFIAMSGETDFDYMSVIRLSPGKPTLMIKTMASTINDRNRDGRLDFGGFHITEAPPGYPDSIYYNEAEFYMIVGDTVIMDTALDRAEDIKRNGVYIPNVSSDTIVRNPVHRKH